MAWPDARDGLRFEHECFQRPCRVELRVRGVEHGCDRLRGDLLPARVAGVVDSQRGSAFVKETRWRCRAAGPEVAPGSEGHEYRDQLLAGLGEVILVSRWALGVLAAFD